MNKPLPQPDDHPSHRRHRQQAWTQILLPVLLASVVILAAIGAACVSTFGGQGDVGRWAAISTIWLILPSLLLELVVLAALGGLIYLAGRLMALIPPYSRGAQRVMQRVESTTKRGAEMVRKPSLAVRGFGSFVRSRFQRRERT